MASTLFTPLILPTVDGSGIKARNRAFVAPMCQYAVEGRDGVPIDWHLQHLGSFAAGGFGLVATEATAVSAEGRISPQDISLHDDEQQAAHTRIVDFIHSQGSLAAVQLAHAGGKASTYPWLPGFEDGSVPDEDGGWQTVGAVDGQVQPGLRPAVALDEAGIAKVVRAFVDAAVRADQAGYDAIQLHAAHGYLMHQFLSPLTNIRTDSYGGDEERRRRFVIEVVDAVRAVWPAGKVLGIRVSATDWAEDGLDVDTIGRLLEILVRDHGVTWVDVSTGGLGSGDIPVRPGYQVPHAARITEMLDGLEVVVSAVGLIVDAAQAETILGTGQADAVSIGRSALKNPHWAAEAAASLGVPRERIPYAPQLWRAHW